MQSAIIPMRHGTLSSFLTGPPELFPIIASLIPLRSAPPTLLSLALANRWFYDIFHPLLYSRLILRNENDAIMVFEKILGEPTLGLAITELYVRSDLSPETRKGKKPFDVVGGLQLLVKKGLIPRLSALGIYLSDSWRRDEHYRPLKSFGYLLTDFWKNLRTECPHLRALALRNIGHGAKDPWLSGPVIDEINRITGLSMLSLEWRGEGLSEKDDAKILNNLSRLASSLHTLNLETVDRDAHPILSLDFPNLKWLGLQRFKSGNNVWDSMAFFQRHPQIETLSLRGCRQNWFSHDIEVGTFLPNLKHLKARFEDIRILVPILPQLVSLSIFESRNGQVPYLLRAVLPNGLAQLKSLEIEMTPAAGNERELEGVLWYETVDGVFCTDETRKEVPRTFVHGYLHSIVRGAPNLEELGLHGMILDATALTKLGPTLAQLVKMERFYYRGYSADMPDNDNPEKRAYREKLFKFLSSAEELACLCPRLMSVTNMNGRDLPYPSVIIERSPTGDVKGVRGSDGVGMLISAHEMNPFPYNIC